ncbi:MAG: CHRD domain-containing protein [Gemmatimonas sp.]|nr:CHRD domain-containing protein [Gemmatimonas sp.]
MPIRPPSSSRRPSRWGGPWSTSSWDPASGSSTDRTRRTSGRTDVEGSFTAANIRGIGGQPAISLDSLSSLLRNGQGYGNVHSSRFPAGEIRGQLGPPPT